MKGLYCPNCGKRQTVKLDIPSRILVPCPECAKPLLVKIDKGKFSVLIEENLHNVKVSASSPV